VCVERLKLVDYYTVPWEDVRAGTPPPVMIATLELATGKEEVFAWHLVAEVRGIRPEEIPSRKTELERQVLQEFSSYLRQNPRTWWLHWGLNGVSYGFPALAQRAKALNVGELRFPEGRMIDLAELFKRRLGEEYVPHKRLPSLIQLNTINRHELLDLPELTAAFRAGDYCHMLRSLRRKLCCISRIVMLGAEGALQTAVGPLVLPSAFGGIGKAGWMAYARDVREARRAGRGRPGREVTTPSPPAAAEPHFIPTQVQKEVLDLLKGKVLTLDALAEKLNHDRSTLHRRALKELMQRGKVKNNQRVGGYYRPDAPPAAYHDLLYEPPSGVR
jgi:hypothetical protein